MYWNLGDPFKPQEPLTVAVRNARITSLARGWVTFVDSRTSLSILTAGFRAADGSRLRPTGALSPQTSSVTTARRITMATPGRSTTRRYFHRISFEPVRTMVFYEL